MSDLDANLHDPSAYLDPPTVDMAPEDAAADDTLTDQEAANWAGVDVDEIKRLRGRS